MAELASTRGWGPGWPNCQSGTIKVLVRKDGIRLPVRKEILELVGWLADETERRGYDLVNGWCWGYACRAIRGSSSPSNHSWGLAVDINAPRNPMGSRLITDMPGWMPALWGAHMFRWGGSYHSRPDAMHYEFMGTPADAARITADLRKGTAPVKVASALPIRLTKPYTKNCLVAEYQTLANKFNARNHIRPNQLKVDGVYGPTTADWTVGFKDWNIALQHALRMQVWPNNDNIVGPVTLGTLQFWCASL